VGEREITVVLGMMIRAKLMYATFTVVTDQVEPWKQL